MNYIKTTIDTAGSLPIDIHAYHGEAIRLNVELRNYGEPIITAEQLVCKVYYQELSTSSPNEWYESEDAVILRENDSTSVEFFWSDKLDGGADAYRYFIRLENGDSISYAIRGNIYLSASPGFTPNSIVLPIKTLDFNAIKVENAPYYEKKEIDEKINSIKETLEEHASDIEELREAATGGANESLKTHEENYNNPHRVKVEQLTEKSATAGIFQFYFSETDNHPRGFIDFWFDPAMFNSGEVSFTALYNGTPLPFNAMVHRLDLSNFGKSLIFRSDEKYYISDGEYYIDFILNDINSDDFSFGLSINPNESFENFDGTHFLITNNTNPVEEKKYKQGGTYKVLTEAMLRDEITGIAYTLKVSNGELHLVEYREESFEG